MISLLEHVFKNESTYPLLFLYIVGVIKNYYKLLRPSRLVYLKYIIKSEHRSHLDISIMFIIIIIKVIFLSLFSIKFFDIFRVDIDDYIHGKIELNLNESISIINDFKKRTLYLEVFYSVKRVDNYFEFVKHEIDIETGNVMKVHLNKRVKRDLLYLVAHSLLREGLIKEHLEN